MILKITFIVLLLTSPAFALDDCKASFFNPITDIRWDAVFPIEIAGIEIKGPSTIPNPDRLRKVVCACKKGGSITAGIAVSYWNPSRLIETTKVPYCFPTLGGLKLSGGTTGTKYGTNDTDARRSKQNVHWYVFPVWHILDLFLDVPCMPVEGFDLAYLTEIDPMWNNDLTGFILNPEAILFANPIAQLACVADSVAATVNRPIDPLFWCMGSWNSVYPLTGSISEPNYIKANAGLAARMIYKMNRMALFWDTAISLCGAQITPIWHKSHFKIHMMKPVRSEPMMIGRPSLLWEHAKNPPWGTGKGAPDNFSWMMFQRVKCCLGPRF